MYAKLIDGRLNPAPSMLIAGDAVVYNPTDETLVDLGYLPVVETEYPETTEIMAEEWFIENGRIVRRWIEVEPIPVEMTDTERMRLDIEELKEQNQMLIDCLLEMSGMVYGA